MNETYRKIETAVRCEYKDAFINVLSELYLNKRILLESSDLLTATKLNDEYYFMERGIEFALRECFSLPDRKFIKECAKDIAKNMYSINHTIEEMKGEEENG